MIPMLSVRLTVLVALLAASAAILSLCRLEALRSGVEIAHEEVGATPVTLYRSGTGGGSLVVVSHGFAGSRQMMEAISLTLARAGHEVAAFDYVGHGRHPRPMSPEIGSLTGTTADLVDQTVAVANWARDRVDATQVALVGHSMATDVVIRAAQRLDGVDGVAAISMYSEAVTPDHPDRLLIVSGARESRLREIALDAVAQIGTAEEGRTVAAGGVTRRAVAAPLVGHVGVLWSPATLTEITAWLGDPAAPARSGPWIATLLAALVALFQPIASAVPAGAGMAGPAPLRGRALAIAIAIATPLACLGAMTGLPLLGLAGFGGLALGFGLFGAGILAIRRPSPAMPSASGVAAGLLLAGWGLGVFALALDRYGAAFVPTGPRTWLMLALVPATCVFAVADRVLVQGRRLPARLLLRLPVLAALLVAIVLRPERMGLVFTVLPVLVLYFAVYGTMAGWLARRAGPVGPGIGAGRILAWSVAASTPLFATP